MEQLIGKDTTELIGLKDKNIKIKTVFKVDTHITIEASLDYQPPSLPSLQKSDEQVWLSTSSTIQSLMSKACQQFSNQEATLSMQGCRRNSSEIQLSQEALPNLKACPPENHTIPYRKVN